MGEARSSVRWIFPQDLHKNEVIVVARLAHDQRTPQQTCNFVDQRDDYALSCRFFISRLIYDIRFTSSCLDDS
jgi:hypothetical protein